MIALNNRICATIVAVEGSPAAMSLSAIRYAAPGTFTNRAATNTIGAEPRESTRCDHGSAFVRAGSAATVAALASPLRAAFRARMRSS